LSVLPNKKDGFQGILFFPGKFPIQPLEPIIENVDLTNYTADHSSFIILGQNKKKFSEPFDVATSNIPVKYSKSVLSSEKNRHNARSVTVVGDINNDTIADLIIGYHAFSLAIVYFGKEEGFASLSPSSTIYGEEYSEFGWAVSGLGDINGDSIVDFMISAKAQGTIYVFFGKTGLNFPNRNVQTHSLSVSDGFTIVGSATKLNTGVALGKCGDFNNDGQNDILFSSQTPDSQGIVYILFGNHESAIRNVSLDHLEASTAVLTIIAPTSRLSGFSLAGIGDINNDGFDDIAIGSVFYTGKEITYLIYGRAITGKRETLELSSMQEGIDGITITGAGFMVTGPGDLNGDGIDDLMIIKYSRWQGAFGSYFVQYPEKFTSSPTLSPTSFPSSQPSAWPSFRVPSNLPTVLSTPPPTPMNETNAPIQSRSPSTVRPSLVPSNPLSLSSLVPTLFPTVEPTFSPTLLPYASSVPSYIPTLLKLSGQPTIRVVSNRTRLPTVDFHRLRGSLSPSRYPTIMPTINATNYIDVDCSKAGKTYEGKNDTHYKFMITVTSGTVQLIGNEDGGAKNLFVLQSCPSKDHRVNVVIKNFRLSTDILSVAHLSSGLYSSMKDLTYSLKAGQPLTFLFCPPENKLQVIMSSHPSFDLTESNFLFIPADSKTDNNQMRKKNVNSRNFKFVQIAIAGGVFLFLLAIGGALAYQNKLKTKEDEKREQLFLQKLLNHSEMMIEKELEMDSWEEEEDEDDDEEQEHEFVSHSFQEFLEGERRSNRSSLPAAKLDPVSFLSGSSSSSSFPSPYYSSSPTYSHSNNNNNSHGNNHHHSSSFTSESSRHYDTLSSSASSSSYSSAVSSSSQDHHHHDHPSLEQTTRSKSYYYRRNGITITSPLSPAATSDSFSTLEEEDQQQDHNNDDEQKDFQEDVSHEDDDDIDHEDSGSGSSYDLSSSELENSTSY
jgi:hypothetical protein